MNTIIGPNLPEPQFSAVKTLWEDIADEFGEDSIGVQYEDVNPYPHITMYALDDAAAVGTIASAVESAVEHHDPFTVTTDGVGVFPGNNVWLPVGKSPQLLELHRDVVEAVHPLGTAPVPYYEPHRWFPHVGFALQVADEQIGDVVSFLLGYDLEWEIPIDDISITRKPTPEAAHELEATIEL
ncbi:2'-5' RNA ligase family protein [Halobacteriaceae archaeon GCM10025711]